MGIALIFSAIIEEDEVLALQEENDKLRKRLQELKDADD